MKYEADCKILKLRLQRTFEVIGLVKRVLIDADCEPMRPER